MLTATFIAAIICLCISFSKPKESFTEDPPPPGPGAVLLADNEGSLTTYPLQDLISDIKSSVTDLAAQVKKIKSEVDGKISIGQTVGIQSYVYYEPNIPTPTDAPTWLENDSGNAVLSVEGPGNQGQSPKRYERTWILIPVNRP
jgi:hypothetical protein